MLQQYLQSLRHALRGLQTAIARERNLKLFLGIIAGVIVIAWTLQIQDWEWAILILAGGAFVGVEILNTAIEHLTDIFDERIKGSEFEKTHFQEIKAVKDVASAAALVAGGAAVIVTVIILWPYVMTGTVG